MLRSNVPRAVRALRHRRRWRQSDLAAASGLSRQVISRLELGTSLGSVNLRTLRLLAEALDASIDVTVRWNGEQLDHLIDRAHAELVEVCAARVQSFGWVTRTEVSFNHYGDRGRVDILAWHPVRAILLVAEVKSAIGDTQDTIGRLDVKERLGAHLAGLAGWGAPRAVVPALIVGESRGSRRIVADHVAAFARFTLRGRQAHAWLRSPDPASAVGLLWFAVQPRSVGHARDRRVRPAPVHRSG